ncbi:MAG TPA: hypothetical protein PKE65_01765 [Rhizobiaceae bacterium]|nr:hypothetical protein [Rhizobiaceae bacterium]
MTTKRFILAAMLAWAFPAAAEPVFPENAVISLIDRSGQELAVGGVKFSQSEQGHTRFSVELDSPRFTDQFLSMRPFRCIEGESEWFCHLPYPYALRGEVTTGDLTELEYSLLFLRKTPAEFGIDAWNGLYFDLEFDDDGALRGRLLEGDLGVLASPPAQEFGRPIRLDEFIAAGKDRLFPAIVIQ